MPIIKLPSSITEKEALKIVNAQGLFKIISIARKKDGSIIINAE